MKHKDGSDWEGVIILATSAKSVLQISRSDAWYLPLKQWDNRSDVELA